MALALDEPTDDDSVLENNGFTFCIKKELLTQIEAVAIDLTYLGFTVTPKVPLSTGSGGSSCGSCSTAGHCH